MSVSPTSEDYPGELSVLRGVVGVIRIIAEHGDINELRRVLAEHAVDELAAYAAGGEKATAPAAKATPEQDASDPLPVRWDRTVIHPEADPTDDTIVCCLADDGRPVALFLDDEHREALGLLLVEPDGDEETAAPRLGRLAQLLDTIRTHGGRWTTRRVQDVRRRKGQASQRGAARHDLAELHRRGHLVEHGPQDGRFYTLATREDRRA